MRKERHLERNQKTRNLYASERKKKNQIAGSSAPRQTQTFLIKEAPQAIVLYASIGLLPSLPLIQNQAAQA
jgi:hypothetical protein